MIIWYALLATYHIEEQIARSTPQMGQKTTIAEFTFPRGLRSHSGGIPDAPNTTLPFAKQYRRKTDK